MNDEQMDPRKPDKKLAAVCGLFCASCSLYIGTAEDPERLKALSARFQIPVEELLCHGCRSEKRAFFCRDICKMTKCAAAKGVDFCGECGEYPCADLKAFQVQMPHRIELWKNLDRIREAGFEKWYKEMVERYACAGCGALNSAYDIACRKCGNTPGCNYVRDHKDEIMQSQARLLFHEE
jgi:hypothetical protein